MARTPPSRLRIRGARRQLGAGACRAQSPAPFARHEYAFSRAIEGGETIVDGNDVDTAPRNLHTLAFDVRFGEADAVAAGRRTTVYVGQLLPRCRQHRHRIPGTRGQPARRVEPAEGDWRITLRVDNLFDTRYADRADFAFGNYRYFPARGRALFLSVDFARN